MLLLLLPDEYWPMLFLLSVIPGSSLPKVTVVITWWVLSDVVVVVWNPWVISSKGYCCYFLMSTVRCCCCCLESWGHVFQRSLLILPEEYCPMLLLLSVILGLSLPKIVVVITWRILSDVVVVVWDPGVNSEVKQFLAIWKREDENYFLSDRVLRISTNPELWLFFLMEIVFSRNTFFDLLSF